MDVTGVIEHIGDMEEIALEGKPLHHKREVLLHVDGKFPKKILIKFWGEAMCRHLNVHSVGDEVMVMTNVESKMVKGIWHTNITGFFIENVLNLSKQQ
jgi:hypothetical protein